MYNYTPIFDTLATISGSFSDNNYTIPGIVHESNFLKKPRKM